jgi:hypothetical protein
VALLGACFNLVVPTGMTEKEREQWWISAKAALSGIPADLLERGCNHAMRVADHPSKIVKAINDEVGELWDARKSHARKVQAHLDRLANPPAPEPLMITDQVDPELFREFVAAFTGGNMREFGAKHGFDSE